LRRGGRYQRPNVRRFRPNSRIARQAVTMENRSAREIYSGVDNTATYMLADQNDLAGDPFDDDDTWV